MAYQGLVGRPTKFSPKRVEKWLAKAFEALPVYRDTYDDDGKKTGQEEVGQRLRSNLDLCRSVGWTEGTLYNYLGIGRRCRAGEAHPQSQLFVEFLQAYERLQDVREELRIEQANKVIEEDQAGQRVRVTIETETVASAGLTPLQELVAALDGTPILTLVQLCPDRQIGDVYLRAKEQASRGERIVKRKKKVEPLLPSTAIARWQKDRTTYRKQVAQAAGAGGDIGPDADPEEVKPRLRMLLAGDADFLDDVQAMINEIRAEA